MNKAGGLLLFAAIAYCLGPQLTACEPPNGQGIQRDATEQEPSPKYEQGYDPSKSGRNQVGQIADDAWGEVVNGLQAAISAPDRIRLNEVVTAYLVLRNVSEKTIRMSLPPHPDILSFRRDDGLWAS